MKRTVLVTGSAGFIGAALVRHLSASKTARVIGVDRKEIISQGPLLFRLDLLDQAAVERFLRRHRPRIIFHLAGGRLADPCMMFSANVMTTYVLMKSILAVRAYHPRVIVIGSAAEYGVCAGDRPITEDRQGEVDGIYGRCKVFQTRVALHFVSLGVDVVVGRLFNIFGPGILEASVAGKFARDILALERAPGIKSLSTGNLSAVRDFLDIRDICSALSCLAKKGRSGEIYNVCSQRGTSIRRLLAQMIRASGRKKIIVREDSAKDPGVLRAVGSCAKLKKGTGWRQRYTFRQSVRDMLVCSRSITGAC